VSTTSSPGPVATRAAPPAPGRPRPGRRPAALPGLLTLLVALAVVGVVALAVGSNPIGLGTTWRVLWHPDGSQASVIVHDLRLPRAVLGILVGAALGAAGALMQGHTRNPLADPGLLGVSAGAAFAVVLGISAFGLRSPQAYVWLALLGAAVASVAVFAIGASGGRRPSPLSLVLAGAAVSALLDALTSALVLGDQDALDDYRFWVVGSVSDRGWDVVRDVTPFLVVGLVLAVAHSPSLNVLSLGDDVARALGQRVGLARAVGLLAVMLLTGAATAACGPIGFVGLVVPHVARLWTGPDHRWLVPFSAVLGAILLLGADVVGRVVARPGELQVGIVLAVLGAPFFVALVRRRKLVAL
jgi:iron complex transport system permease protein